MPKSGILVTGGSGLVGANVVHMLLDRGERPVVFDVAINEKLLAAFGVDVESPAVVRGAVFYLDYAETLKIEQS